jgi:hypothetical protein
MRPSAESFAVGDMVRTPLGRVATVLREVQDGKVLLEYVGAVGKYKTESWVVLDPKLLKVYER